MVYSQFVLGLNCFFIEIADVLLFYVLSFHLTDIVVLFEKIVNSHTIFVTSKQYFETILSVCW